MRVLLVDDRESIRELLEEIIISSLPDVEVITAGSAVEAWEKFKEEGRLDLVVTDLHMETKTAGLALAETIKKETPETPVVLMSATPEITLTGFGVVDAFIEKPFNINEFVALIKKFL